MLVHSIAIVSSGVVFFAGGVDVGVGVHSIAAVDTVMKPPITTVRWQMYCRCAVGRDVLSVINPLLQVLLHHSLHALAQHTTIP